MRGLKYNYNVIAVIDETGTHALFCMRKKPPYQGCWNFVGGKIEPGEDGLAAAYRELSEETGIDEDAIDLTHLMNFEYVLEDCRMEVYAGRLKRHVDVVDEVNHLEWLPVEQDYADITRFAGVGNVGHMIYYIREFLNLIEK